MSVFNNTGSNTEVMRLEIEETPTGLVNMVQNPSGELGAWGWGTPVVGSTLKGVNGPGGSDPDDQNKYGQKLIYSAAGSVANYFYTASMPVAAGQYVAASWVPMYVANYYKAKIEWLDSAGVLISSATQTGYLDGLGPDVASYYGPFLAPASTVYCRLRFDQYNTTAGANPATGHDMIFKEVTVVKAATSGELGTLRNNMLSNPSFETSTTSWQSYDGGCTLSSSTTFASEGTKSMKVTPTSSGAGWDVIQVVGSSIKTVTPGKDYTFQMKSRAGTIPASFQIYIVGYNGTTALESYEGALETTTVGAWATHTITFTAGSSVNGVKFWFTFSDDAITTSTFFYVDDLILSLTSEFTGYFSGATPAAGGVTYGWAGTAHASASTATTTDVYYIPPVTYRNILAPAHEITVSRSDLDVGTMQATVLDAAIDPATADLIRPGKRIRLSALSPTVSGVPGTFQTIFSGKVTNAAVEYDVKNMNTRAAELVATNVISNPGFEVNTTSWNVLNGSTVTRDTATFHSGVASCKVVTTGSAQGVISSSAMTPAGFFATGTSVTVTAWVLADAGATFRLYAGTSGTGAVTGTTLFTGTGDWQMVSVAAVAGTSSNTFRVNTQGAQALTFYVDDWTVVTGTVVEDFNGDTESATEFEFAWTGTAGQSTSTKKTYAVPPSSKGTKISLTATDNVTTLANTAQRSGVGTIAELPYLLEGSNVPWLVNGNGNQVATATVVATNDNASVLDQIAITRDSGSGYAWVNRNGVLIANTYANMGASVAVLDETVYSDLNVNYNTDQCINEVTVKWLRYDSATGETQEIPYGPYRDATSISAYGVHSVEFTLQGTENPTTIAAYAAAVLAANGTPVIRMNSITVPIKVSADLSASKAFLDLYDKVNRVNAAKGFDDFAYITGIKHTITPDKWVMDLEFSETSSVASPQLTPSPGVANTTAGWQNLSYAAGFSAGTPGQLQWRVLNSVVYIRGGATGTFTGGTQVIVTGTPIPAAYRPTATHHNGTYGTGSRGCVVEARTDGHIYLTGENGTTGVTWVAADISYVLG